MKWISKHGDFIFKKIYLLAVKCSKCCARNCGFLKRWNKYIIISVLWHFLAIPPSWLTYSNSTPLWKPNKLLQVSREFLSIVSKLRLKFSCQEIWIVVLYCLFVEISSFNLQIEFVQRLYAQIFIALFSHFSKKKSQGASALRLYIPRISFVRVVGIWGP